MILNKCNNCNKYNYKKHNFIFHKTRKIERNKRKYILNCVYCKKSFTIKNNIKRHIKNKL